MNDIVAQYGMNCEWAGSQKKHTHVDGYSDADIWIETYNKTVTSETRSQITKSILKCMAKCNLFVHIQDPKYKPVATSFEANGYTIDIIFSNAEWIKDTNRVIPPDNVTFYMKSERQRAVKGLKLLSREVNVRVY